MVEIYDSPAQVCEWMNGMTTQLLKQMRFRGDGPPFIRVSPRRIVYRRSAVEAWMRDRERVSTREVA